MSHNYVISNQATPWLKKNDSQTTICKILLSAKVGNLLSYCTGRSCVGPRKMFDLFYNNFSSVRCSLFELLATR